MSGAGRNRTWVREQFTDHPRAHTKDDDTYAGGGKTKDKIKVFCTSCLERAIQEEQALDISQSIPQPRSREAIVEHLFAKMEGRQWLPSHSETLINHLSHCSHVSVSVREEARSRKSSKPISSSRVPAPMYSHGPGPSGGYPMVYGTPLPSGLDAGMATLQPPTLPMIPRVEAISREGSVVSSAVSSLSPSDSVSAIGAKRSRTNSGNISRRQPSGSFIGDTQIQWTNGDQILFENILIRLTASANLPLSWIENPEFIELISRFLRHAKIPTRRALTSTLLTRVVGNIRQGLFPDNQERLGTAQCDGWTGENHHHYIAFMVAVDRKIYTYKVHDASSERRFAEGLLALMKEVISGLKKDWNVKVIAFTSDASGESRKARRLLQAEQPQLVTPDCYGHQINLIVGDYFKVDSQIKVYAGQATELIGWLRGKPLILAAIRNIQKTGPSAVIRAVLTRWTSHCLAFRRLLQLRKALDVLLAKEVIAESENAEAEKIMLTGDRKAKAKAKEMMDLMRDAGFWQALARIVLNLEPLARATNVAQAASCRPDEVLLMLGSLRIFYDSQLAAIQSDVNDMQFAPCTAILKSLETRWSKTDQEVFIAAVVLNPVIKTAAFNQRSPYCLLATLIDLLERLYKRFFGGAAPPELFVELQQYLNNQGTYVHLPAMVSRFSMMASAEKSSVDPVVIYDSILPKGQDPTPLPKLALHLFAICTNSASCERLFSVFGNTLTKLRNRMATQTLTDLAELRMHVRDEHLRDGEKKSRVKRTFGKRQEDNVATEPTATPAHTTTAPSPPPAANTEAINPNSIDPSLMESSPSGVDCVFNQLAQTYANIDDGDNEAAPRRTSAGFEKIALSDLFDKSTQHWVASFQLQASRTLEEELALYELDSMDADGEDDGGLIDETVDSILFT